MLDKERILSKIGTLDGYLEELRQIAPKTIKDYYKIEKKRACERLLQISIECVIEICGLMVSGLKLGLPGEDNDLFEKLKRAGVLSASLTSKLQRMKGFRNILVHEYGEIRDDVVLQILRKNLKDFSIFKRSIIKRIK